MWSMNRSEGFIQNEGKHARMATFADGAFAPWTRHQSDKGRHRLKPMLQLGDLTDVVYYNAGRGGFMRADDAKMEVLT